MDKFDSALWSELTIKERLQAIPRLQKDISKQNILETGEDGFVTLLVAMSESTREPNPRLAQGALEVATMLVSKVGREVGPYAKVVMGAVVAGLGNIKLPVRERATALIRQTVESAGLEVTLNHIVSQLEQNDNWRVRAGLLDILLELCKKHGPLYRDLTDVLATAFNDQHDGLRKSALELAVQLHLFHGNVVSSKLKAKGVRQTHLGKLQERTKPTEGKENKRNDRGTSLLRTSNEGGLSSSSQNVPQMLLAMGRKKGDSRSQSDVKRLADAAAAQEAEPELSPIQVFTEAEMGRELERIETWLRNVDEWHMRLDGIQRIHRLALGGGEQFTEFGKGLKAMHDLIDVQISDLRSSLSKEACRAVAAVATAMGDEFAGLADLWAPALLRLCVNSVAVIAYAGEASLRTIIAASRRGYPSLMRVLLSAAAKRKGLERPYCLQFISQALRHWTGMRDKGTASAHDNLKSSLERVIMDRLADANAACRSQARMCYWDLLPVAPMAAARIRRSLDANAQKHLERARIERESQEKKIKKNRPIGYESTTEEDSLTATTDVQASDTSNIVSKPSSHSQGVEVVNGRGIQGSTATRRHRNGLSMPSREPRRSTSHDNSKQEIRGVDLEQSSYPPPPALSIEEDNNGSIDCRRTSVMPPQTAPSRLSGVKRINISNVVRNEGGIMSRPMQMHTKHSSTNTSVSVFRSDSNVAGTGRSSIGGALRLPRRVAKPPSPPHETVVSLPGTSSTCFLSDSCDKVLGKSFHSRAEFSPITSSKGPKADCEADIDVPAPSSSSSLSSLPRGTIIPLELQPSTSTEEIILQLRAIEEGGVPWNKRLTTARLLGQLLGRYPGGGLNRPTLRRHRSATLLDRCGQKICRTGLQSILSDGHHKVVLAALQSIAQWLQNAASHQASQKNHDDIEPPCEAILDILLPAVAQRLADTKSTSATAVRAVARNIFDCVRDCCDAPTLVHCITGLLLGDYTDKVKLTLIDFLMPLVPLAATFLLHGSTGGNSNSSSNLRTLLNRLANLIMGISGAVNATPSTSSSHRGGGSNCSREGVALQEAACSALAALYRLNLVSFVSAFRSLPLEYQNGLRAIIDPLLPDLKDDLLNASKEARRSQQIRLQQKQQSDEILDGSAAAQDTAVMHVKVRSPSNATHILGGKKTATVHKTGHHPQTFAAVSAESVSALTEPLLVSGAELQSLKDGLDISSNDRVGSNPWDLRLASAHKLIRIAQEKRLGSSDFGNVLFILLEGFAAGNGCREAVLSGTSVSRGIELQVLTAHHMALAALRSLVKNYPKSFNGYVDLMVKKLLALCTIFPYELSQAAEAILGTLLTSKALDPIICLAALHPFIGIDGVNVISVGGAPKLQALRVLALLIPRVPSASLLHSIAAQECEKLPEPEVAVMPIMPSLVQALSSEVVDIRKSSVLALVEVYCNVGDAVLPHYESGLSTQQMKLVTIYIEKRG